MFCVKARKPTVSFLKITATCSDPMMLTRFLRHERLFSWNRQRWKDVWIQQTLERMLGWWRIINMTQQTVGDKHWVLAWFAPPWYSSLKAHTYWFTLHCVVELCLWWCHREKLAEELLMRFPQLLAAAADLGWLASLTVSYGLNCSCWFVCWCLLVD